MNMDIETAYTVRLQKAVYNVYIIHAGLVISYEWLQIGAILNKIDGNELERNRIMTKDQIQLADQWHFRHVIRIVEYRQLWCFNSDIIVSFGSWIENVI